MSIGSKLNDLRIKNNRSLQEVADAIGASKAHIWDLEKGNSSNPSLELLSKIAGYFRISIAELVGEDPNALNEKPELVALYRDLKTLNEKDREVVQAVIEKLKPQKTDK